MKRIQMQETLSIEDCFQQFLSEKATNGAVEKTIVSYRYQFKAISKHLLTNISISELSLEQLNNIGLFAFLAKFEQGVSEAKETGSRTVSAPTCVLN